MRRLIFVFLLGAAAPVWALNVADPTRFVCKQGDCRNGQGTVWDAALNVTMQGNWANGQTIPGMNYNVVSPVQPGKVFKQVYAADGLLQSGDQPRSLASFKVVPWFSGTYTRMHHPFMRQNLAVIKHGVYDNGLGVQYRGQFEYLAAKSGMNTGMGSGFFVFYGERVDTEEDEKETGLFISDEAIGGTPVRFVKADPSYLAVMQGKYQRDMALAKVEFKQQDSEKRWRMALAIVGKVALAAASGGASLAAGNNGLGTELAMNLVTSLFNNGGEVNVKELALQVVGAAVVGDKQLGSALGKAISEGIDEANAK